MKKYYSFKDRIKKNKKIVSKWALWKQRIEISAESAKKGYLSC